MSIKIVNPHSSYWDAPLKAAGLDPLKIRALDDVGAYAGRSPLQLGKPVGAIVGPYRIGSVEYELRIDTSGFTYRSRTDLPRPVLECVDDVLNGIVATIRVPHDVKASTRTFTIRR